MISFKNSPWFDYELTIYGFILQSFCSCLNELIFHLFSNVWRFRLKYSFCGRIAKYLSDLMINESEIYEFLKISFWVSYRKLFSEKNEWKNSFKTPAIVENIAEDPYLYVFVFSHLTNFPFWDSFWLLNIYSLTLILTKWKKKQCSQNASRMTVRT